MWKLWRLANGSGAVYNTARPKVGQVAPLPMSEEPWAPRATFRAPHPFLGLRELG